jgi:hypothetical protein
LAERLAGVFPNFKANDKILLHAFDEIKQGDDIK